MSSEEAKMEASDKIDIGEPVAEICKRLGLEYANVGRLDVRPTSVAAEVFKIRDGAKYVDEETEKVAVETVSFKVAT